MELRPTAIWPEFRQLQGLADEIAVPLPASIPDNTNGSNQSLKCIGARPGCIPISPSPSRPLLLHAIPVGVPHRVEAVTGTEPVLSDSAVVRSVASRPKIGT